ncbi:hypothetical protein [Maribacter sp. Hel_I_7]|uniref:hypothetical protein n=1 Tax=Maribacter sp. Hel_I_7 TaxID=1249997 RepID=UPI000A96CFAB|nr:hypothetical protein [Maribacter sp. Hel_I_7]
MMKKITFFLASFIMVILASCSKEENIDESTSDEILKPISNDDAFLIPSGTQIVKDSLQFTLKLKDFDLEIDFNEIHSISLFFKDPILNEMKPLAYIDLERDYRISYEGGSDLEELDYTIYIENADGTDYFGSSFELKNLTIIGLNISKIRDIPTGTLDYRDFDQLVNYFNLHD